MADWFAVYQESDGELVSLGTVLAGPLPAGLAKSPFDGPLVKGQRWNPATLTFERAPADPPKIDRVAEFLAALNGRSDASLRPRLEALLGLDQFRNP